MFLLDYDFPGNIRELENIIEYAFVMCKGNIIELEHLPRDIHDSVQRKDPLTEAETRERAKIKAVLEQYPNSRQEAARALGISRTTLWRKMKRYRII
jgi:transcriptional regulator with PAS, ATPase and Fis domain